MISKNEKIFTGLGQVGVWRVGAHPVCRAEKPNLFIFYFIGWILHFAAKNKLHN